MRTILLPTDFSANARNACRYAIDMFRNEKVLFVLLHAYKVFDYHEKSHLAAVPGEPTLSYARKEVLSKLRKTREELDRIITSSHTIEMEIYNLPVTDAITKVLQRRTAELIVIGSQGHTAAQEVLYGANTLQIFEEIENCPILSVPANITFKPLNEIVLAHSFRTELSQGDLDFLISLTNTYNAALRILHIAEEGGLDKSQHQNKKLLENKLGNVKHSFHTLEYLSVPLGIYSFAESRGSGMIAFLNRKHSFFENLLLNPLYKNIANLLRVPVLVLHQPARTD